MKRILSALAVSGLLALGVTAIATSSSASPLSTGAATVGTVKTLAQPEDIVNIHHRRGHFGPGPVLPPWYGGPTPVYGGPGPALPPWYRRGHRHRHHHGGRSPWFGGPWGNPWWDDEPDYGSSSNFVLQFNVQPRPRYRAPRYTLSAAHVRWCEARYRSYRISDDSFQPYNGPRRQCISPYD